MAALLKLSIFMAAIILAASVPVPDKKLGAHSDLITSEPEVEKVQKIVKGVEGKIREKCCASLKGCNPKSGDVKVTGFTSQIVAGTNYKIWATFADKKFIVDLYKPLGNIPAEVKGAKEDNDDQGDKGDKGDKGPILGKSAAGGKEPPMAGGWSDLKTDKKEVEKVQKLIDGAAKDVKDKFCKAQKVKGCESIKIPIKVEGFKGQAVAGMNYQVWVNVLGKKYIIDMHQPLPQSKKPLQINSVKEDKESNTGGQDGGALIGGAPSEVKNDAKDLPEAQKVVNGAAKDIREKLCKIEKKPGCKPDKGDLKVEAFTSQVVAGTNYHVLLSFEGKKYNVNLWKQLNNGPTLVIDAKEGSLKDLEKENKEAGDILGGALPVLGGPDSLPPAWNGGDGADVPPVMNGEDGAGLPPPESGGAEAPVMSGQDGDGLLPPPSGAGKKGSPSVGGKGSLPIRPPSVGGKGSLPIRPPSVGGKDSYPKPPAVGGKSGKPTKPETGPRMAGAPGGVTHKDNSEVQQLVDKNQDAIKKKICDLVKKPECEKSKGKLTVQKTKSQTVAGDKYWAQVQCEATKKTFIVTLIHKEWMKNDKDKVTIDEVKEGTL